MKTNIQDISFKAAVAYNYGKHDKILEKEIAEMGKPHNLKIFKNHECCPALSEFLIR